ncbi:MAG: hypothetical protein ACLUNK_06000 [Mediterraneibacter faecis]
MFESADTNDAIKGVILVDLVLMNVQTFTIVMDWQREEIRSSSKTKVLIITSLIDPEVLARAKQDAQTASGKRSRR